jgi:hypothetical protein
MPHFTRTIKVDRVDDFNPRAQPVSRRVIYFSSPVSQDEKKAVVQILPTPPDVLKVVLCLMVNQLVAKSGIGSCRETETSSDHNNQDTINHDCT